MKKREHQKEKKALFENGASRSQMTERFDLVPEAGVRRAALRFGLGAKKHGDRNWERGDVAFAIATANHLIRHASLLLEPDSADDDLGAVICNAMMLARFEAKGINLKEIVRRAREERA